MTRAAIPASKEPAWLDQMANGQMVSRLSHGVRVAALYGT
jgi:hypothetical protein